MHPEPDPEPQESVVSPISSLLAPADIRYYVLWVIPGHPELTGVAWGQFPNIWNQIARFLPNREYRYSDGTRLKREQSFQEAVTAFRAQAEEWRLHPDLSLQVWSVDRLRML